MASARCTSTPSRVSGPCCAPGSARIAVSRRKSCRTTSASSNMCTTHAVAAKPCSARSSPPWSYDPAQHPGSQQEPQNFEAEMEAMPGKYAPRAGELLLARDRGGTPMGCVGLRPLDAHGCCEMKRLYVLPEGRGSGLGRKLIDAVVREAERIGYHEMRLDTLPSMAGAIALYRKLGFE